MKDYLYYYGMVCPYAYGVYETTITLSRSMPYLNGVEVRSFTDAKEAKHWVENTYAKYQKEVMPLFDPIESFDWCYYRRRLSGKQRSEVKLIKGVYYEQEMQ